MLSEKTLAQLKQRWGFVPEAGERWVVYGVNTLIVCHPNCRPHVYEEGCGGVYYEIVPETI